MRAALLVCAALLARAQAPDAAAVLERAQARLSAAAADTPRYTCTETVDRSYFRETRQVPRSCDAIVAGRRNGRSKLVLSATDRLRFDVEVADGGYEIYGWPGASRIATETVEKMAAGGPLGTGPFGPFLVDIFTNRGAQFQSLGGTGFLEYRYRVPLQSSHYRFQAGAIFRITGYDGTFGLDPSSAELKQLTVRTLELPFDTGACEATTSMDFSPLRIGTADYLIPQRTTLQVTGRDGGSTESTVAYSECHEFRGESAVRFDDPIPVSAAHSETAAPVLSPSVPAGLPVILLLDREIDTGRAAAGDPVTATLQQAMIDPVTKRVLVPAGAVARGRIAQLEHHIEGENYFLVGLRFETLEVPGGSAIPLHLMLDGWRQVQDLRTHRDPLTRTGQQVITTESRAKLPGAGTLVFPATGPRFVVPRGLAMNWITLAP